MSILTPDQIKARLIQLLGMDADIIANFPNTILDYNPKSCSPTGTAGATNASPCLAIDTATTKTSYSTLGQNGKDITAFNLAMLVYVQTANEDSPSKALIERLTQTAVAVLRRYNQDIKWYLLASGPLDQPQPIESSYYYVPGAYRESITEFTIYSQYIRP